MKVLVLPRVIRHVPKYLEDKVSSVNDDIYSTPEKVLLAWLNFHYESQKESWLLRGKGVCVCVCALTHHKLMTTQLINESSVNLTIDYHTYIIQDCFNF